MIVDLTIRQRLERIRDRHANDRQDGWDSMDYADAVQALNTMDVNRWAAFTNDELHALVLDTRTWNSEIAQQLVTEIDAEIARRKEANDR